MQNQGEGWEIKAKNAIEEENIVFDMQKIGSIISRLRRNAALTQMELADRLGISFQAVSNWERGVSMPDIGKLTELSEIFGVSIDEMLDNKRAAQIINEIREESVTTKLTQDEMEGVMPILKPKQAEEVVSRMGISITEIAHVAPFLSEKFLEEEVMREINNGSSLSAVSPILPFLDEDAIAKLAVIVSERDDDSQLTMLFPFMGDDDIVERAQAAYEKTGDINSLARMAPFLPDEWLNSLAEKILKAKGLSALSPILPFIDSDMLEEYIRASRVHSE